MSAAACSDNTVCKREAAEGGAWQQPSGETVTCDSIPRHRCGRLPPQGRRPRRRLGAGRRALRPVIACSLVAHGLATLQAAVALAAPHTAVCLADRQLRRSYVRWRQREARAGRGRARRAPGPAPDRGRCRSNGSHPHPGPLQDRRRSHDRARLDGKIVGPPQPDQRRLLRGRTPGRRPSTSINDTTIAGNLFVGPFGEDAIRLNRYHDSGDPRPLRVLIEGNEITQRARERQPQRLPAVGLGRRRALLPPQLPARQPLPGLLRQGPAGAGAPHRPRRQPDAAQRRARAIRRARAAGRRSIVQIVRPDRGHHDRRATRSGPRATARRCPARRAVRQGRDRPAT